MIVFFFFQAEDGIRDVAVTGVQTCALPILILETLEERRDFSVHGDQGSNLYGREQTVASGAVVEKRSEEHTSELQSRLHLVCRLLLEKKKNAAVALVRVEVKATTMAPLLVT